MLIATNSKLESLNLSGDIEFRQSTNSLELNFF